MYITINTMMINSFLFYILNSPILILISLIFQTFLICLLLKNFIMISWFSMILFLVFVGGLMVMFMYITSLASNITNFNLPTMKMQIIMLIITILTFISLNFMQTNKIFYPIYSMFSLIFKIYASTQVYLILMLMFYLLLVLLVTVSVIMLSQAPLRSLYLK